MLKFSRCWKRF